MLDRKLGSAVPPHSWLRGRLDGIDGRNRDNSFVRGVNVKKLRHVPGTALCRAL